MSILRSIEDSLRNILNIRPRNTEELERLASFRQTRDERRVATENVINPLIGAPIVPVVGAPIIGPGMILHGPVIGTASRLS